MWAEELAPWSAAVAREAIRLLRGEGPFLPAVSAFRTTCRALRERELEAEAARAARGELAAASPTDAAVALTHLGGIRQLIRDTPPATMGPLAASLAGVVDEAARRLRMPESEPLTGAQAPTPTSTPAGPTSAATAPDPAR